MSQLVGKMATIKLTDGRELYGEIVAEDPNSVTMKVSPNPGYSTDPPTIIMRNQIMTITLKS